MKTILVVEDDKILIEAIRAYLSNNGYNLLTAEDGEKALKVVNKNKPEVILLDLMLPRKSGYHVLYELKHDSKTKNIPVIIMTAVDSETSKQECLSNGADDYLVKSEYSLEEIVAKVKKYLK